MKSVTCLFLILWLAPTPAPAGQDDRAARTADRAAVERVYHAHRTGTQRSFDEALPRALLERLVDQDLRKETALQRAYGMTVTPAMLAAEVERIDATTRAPEVLAEVRRALGNDPARFAAAVARPIVVERELRLRFERDDRLHASRRREAERARAALLAGKPVAGLRTLTWQLAPRPAEDQPAPPAAMPAPTRATGSSSSYTNEATAQVGQALASPERPRPGGEKAYFTELDPELQRVLRAQLRRPGDVSAVIEAPGVFLVFQAREIGAERIAVASLALPKRAYDAWLTQAGGR